MKGFILVLLCIAAAFASPLSTPAHAEEKEAAVFSYTIEVIGERIVLVVAKTGEVAASCPITQKLVPYNLTCSKLGKGNECKDPSFRVGCAPKELHVPQR